MGEKIVKIVRFVLESCTFRFRDYTAFHGFAKEFQTFSGFISILYYYGLMVYIHRYS